MPVLVVTPKAADANAYATVARADEILARRLHTETWSAAASTPDAEGYLVDDPSASLTVGATTVPVRSGSGTFTSGCQVKFLGDDTLYTVGVALAAPGDLTISPGLVQVPADGYAVERQTPSTKESALIWATRLLDDLMAWFGAPRTILQPLRWPRIGVTNQDGIWYDFDTIPARLEEGTAELAFWLLDSDRFVVPSVLGKGIKNAKVGPVTVEIDPSQVLDPIPDNILAIMGTLGTLRQGTGPGIGAVKLERA